MLRKTMPNLTVMPNSIVRYFVGAMCVLSTFWVSPASGHGRLVDPPARSTMWRLGFNTPVHYNDHQLFCGGYSRQWTKNHGRCGECGDPWDLPRPRPNEAGGMWGTGVISKVYRQGQIITVTVHLTANHMGWFEFRLCPNNNPKQYVKQSCLNKHVLKLVDYKGTRYELKHSQTGLFRIRLQLPPNVICSQCVVQWHYTTGNNWGYCKDGTNQPGCGPQEVFRGCSDIAIFTPDDPTYFQFLNLTREADLSQFLHLKESPDAGNDVEENSVREEVPVVTEAPQTNDVNLAEVVNVDFEKVKDVKTNDLLRSLSKGPRIQTSRRPSITFLEDRRPSRKHKEKEKLFSLSQVLGGREQGNQIPPTPKKYVSSDDFRKNSRLENGIPVSTETPFLPRGGRLIEQSNPAVINPFLSVTPSPLGPLVFPQTTIDHSSVNRGGIHSVFSSQHSEDYTPVLQDAISKALAPEAPATILIPSHDPVPGLQGVPVSALQLLTGIPSFANSELPDTSRSPVAGLQLPTSLHADDNLQRLLLLQQVLGLAASSSGTNQESPVVLILA